MKKKSSLKDLTQWIVLVTGVFQTANALIELLSKVVNYGGSASELQVRV